MTPYQQRFLDHCVRMAMIQKQYAWSAAKRYAEMDESLKDLPTWLTAEMRQRNEVRSQGGRESGQHS